MSLREHYARFVDGFWLGLADMLWLLGLRKAAHRLFAWNERMMKRF